MCGIKRQFMRCEVTRRVTIRPHALATMSRCHETSSHVTLCHETRHPHLSERRSEMSRYPLVTKDGLYSPAFHHWIMKLFNVTWLVSEHVTEFHDTWHGGLTVIQSIISPDHCSRRSSTLPPNLPSYFSGKFPQWSWQHYHYCTVQCTAVRRPSRHPRWDKKNNKEINIEIIYTHVNKPSLRVNQNEIWAPAASTDIIHDNLVLIS